MGSRIIGCDRPDVLARALKMGAIDQGMENPVEAVKGSDLIFLATPVGAIIDLIERIGPIASPQALITDAGSTKQEILERARAVFGAQVSQRFLGGHPMAGKEHGSIFWAEPGLFRGAVWLLVSAGAVGEAESPAITEYRELLERIGAHVTPLAAERANQFELKKRSGDPMIGGS